MAEIDFNEFTETGYARLLRLAKDKYDFISFPEINIQARSRRNVVLWRHDLDISIHRALRIAEIDADAGVKSTFFFLLHSEFYNLLEKGVLERARRIVALGHWPALHFDLQFCDGEGMEALERAIRREKELLEDVLCAPMTAISFHRPDIGNGLSYNSDLLGGLVNTYGAWMKRDGWHYVSDSNGYWRFKSLREMLESDKVTRLHALTHPEWWSETAMSPRLRVNRAIEGRSRFMSSDYDADLAQYGRVNIR